MCTGCKGCPSFGPDLVHLKKRQYLVRHPRGGVAAEVEFLRLADVAANNGTHGSSFSAVTKQQTIRQKIVKFHDCLRPLIKSLPQQAAEDFDANFVMIQSVLRIARNEAGHVIAETPQREQVYIYMQLFVPFARQMMRLRDALK